MTYSPRFPALALTCASALALVVACSAEGGGVVVPQTDEAGATEPAPTSTLPPSSPPDAGATVDAARDALADAAKDSASEASADSGLDAGTPAPAAGAACKTLDEIFTRSCGICGTQLALCLAKPDGSAGVVSSYSVCENELAEGCLPGTSETEACGNCGTRKRTCTQFCAWSPGACAGEPVDSCAPTFQDFTTAGCPTAGTVRTRQCNDTCSWSNFTATCTPLDYELVVSAAAGGTVSAIYPLRALVSGKRLTGTCPGGYLSSTTNHPYVYVRLVNPTNAEVTLSAWNTATPGGGAIIDTLMGWYAGGTKPADDDARKACSKGMVDSCPAGLPCGDSKWAGLTGASAITLPPLGSALLFFGSYYPAGGASLSEGNVKLVVRTEPSP